MDAATPNRLPYSTPFFESQANLQKGTPSSSWFGQPNFQSLREFWNLKGVFFLWETTPLPSSHKPHSGPFQNSEHLGLEVAGSFQGLIPTAQRFPRGCRHEATKVIEHWTVIARGSRPEISACNRLALRLPRDDSGSYSKRHRKSKTLWTRSTLGRCVRLPWSPPSQFLLRTRPTQTNCADFEVSHLTELLRSLWGARILVAWHKLMASRPWTADGTHATWDALPHECGFSATGCFLSSGPEPCILAFGAATASLLRHFRWTLLSVPFFWVLLGPGNKDSLFFHFFWGQFATQI